MYFFTRSKNASSSAVAPEVEVGGKGSGIIGVNVGDTAGASVAFGLWDNFALYGLLLALFGQLYGGLMKLKK